jgi:hypothetical protein
MQVLQNKETRELAGLAGETQLASTVAVTPDHFGATLSIP